nr:hypothetical protein [uncultured Acetatifactor sp.]
METLVFPMEEQEAEKADIESAVHSLVGAIPATDMSLEETREESRLKYTEKGVKGWLKAHRNEK